MAKSRPTYAIIGGGIVGASIAYHLSEETTEPIKVYDQQSLASETTFKSMAMFGLYGDKTQYQMKRYGLRLYNQFFSEPRARPKYDLAGRLEVATTESGAAELEQNMGSSHAEKSIAGIDRDLLEYIPGDDLSEVLLVPRVNTAAVTGAVFRPRVGYMQPQELAFEFVERARDNGVTFDTGSKITDILTQNGQVTGLETESSKVAADHVICAAGPWNVTLAAKAGVDIPVRHTLAPILKLTVSESAEYSLPTIGHYESPYSIYRQRSRSRDAMFLGYNPSEPVNSVAEFLEKYDVFDPDSMSETVPEDIRDGMLSTAEMLVPSLLDADVADEWVGIRSGTPDGNPIVGWTEVDGFSIAAFHTSGIQLAPKVGDIITQQLVHDNPTDLYDNLSISRFKGYSDVFNGSPATSP